jgi:hypothetical protein
MADAETWTLIQTNKAETGIPQASLFDKKVIINHCRFTYLVFVCDAFQKKMLFSW